MTSLAAGSAVSVGLGDEGSVVITTTGGVASVLVIPAIGVQSIVSLGPAPENRRIGTFQEGATLLITNTSASGFNYDVDTGAIGFAAQGAQAIALQSVAAPYMLASFGDSRNNVVSSGTQIGYCGSGTAWSTQRVPTWIAAYLGDTELIGNFGVSGDTLISSSSTTGWDGVSRVNSKTFANLIASKPDVIYAGPGINDLPSASSDALIAEGKRCISAIFAAGIKLCWSNIMLFDPTASSANITPANAAATLVKINAYRDAMSVYCAGLAGRVVFVDPNPLIALATTGYADPQYIQSSDNLGVHPNRRGAQLMAKQAADAIRTLIPLRNAKCYTEGPLSNPNFIDWGAAATSNIFATNSVVGTSTASTPIWTTDSVTGLPTAKCTFTVTALAGGFAQFFLKVDATDVAGATPKKPLFVGDVIRGSARVVVDDGAGSRAVGVQDVSPRVRMFNTGPTSQFFNDWGGVGGAVLTDLPLVVDGRMSPPASASPIASATLDTPQTGSGRGFFFGVFVEVNALGTYTVSIGAPSLRVVSRPQPVSVTAGTSPWIWQYNPQPFVANDWVNSKAPNARVTIGPGASGTISQIELLNGPTVAGSPLNAVATNMTQGSFVATPGDAFRVTWATTAAVLTYTPA